MATIHVNRGGTNLGTFSEDEVRKGLSEGRFLATDLGWREGMASWQPLSQFPEFAGISAPAAATPTGAAATPNAGPAGMSGEAPPPSAGAVPPSAGDAGVPPLAAAVVVAPGGEPRSGLPWEHREQLGLVNAFVETVKLVLT